MACRAGFGSDSPPYHLIGCGRLSDPHKSPTHACTNQLCARVRLHCWVVAGNAGASHAGEVGVQRSCLQLDFTCDALTITPSPLQGCQRRPPGSRDRSRRTIDRVKYDAPDAEAGSKGSLAARHHQLRGLLDKKWQLEFHEPLAKSVFRRPAVVGYVQGTQLT